MRKTMQSSLEFMSVYGVVFFAISIVIVIFYLFSSLPNNVIPHNCEIYSGLACLDIAYSNSTLASNSVLTVLASDTQSGIVNVSSFTARVGGFSGVGTCAPSRLVSGQEAICTANIPQTINPAQAYTGSFEIKADYCTVQATANAICPASSDYEFAGGFVVQGQAPQIITIPTTSTTSTIPTTTTIHYISITLTNNQGSGTAVPFQQNLSFSFAHYGSLVTTTLSNIRFYIGTATTANELVSWCESDCSPSASANALFWIGLNTVSIPGGGGKLVVNMTFQPLAGANSAYDGAYAGEANFHDNGAALFTDYWNETQLTLGGLANNGLGGALPTGWVFNIPYTADNAFINYYSSTPLVPPIVLETQVQEPSTYTTSNSYIDAPLYTDYDTSKFASLGNWNANSGAPSIGKGFWCDYRNSPTPGNPANPNTNPQAGSYVAGYSSNTQVDTLLIPSYTTQTCMVNYTSATLQTSSLSSSYSYYAGLDDAYKLTALYWYRVRVYPPSGIMPSVTFGPLH